MSRLPTGLLKLLDGHDRLVEVGIGFRTTVAAELVDRGVAVTAVDRVRRDVPPGVDFVQDDVTDPTWTGYGDADAIYALRLPPELQRPAADLADAASIPLYFTTLGGDPVLISARMQETESGPVYVHNTSARRDRTHN
ncbi:UPF0146 family protein [Halodesulfurarchaeum formicicum]|uniref:UPF0146 family protein n=1 Tax=Halodesulfurarchaeum formicicum TaxID=1873524 RepID=UPI000ACD1561|nr:UPF0146 family protein [Halodesulfurarchaeum formicicum]